MTEAQSPRRRKLSETPKLALRRKRALLADIIGSNRSALEPGLNPDMEAAERDLLVMYIEALELWEAEFGRADTPPAVDELKWRAGVLDSEIRSWTNILQNDPTLSHKERSDFMDTLAELERWKAELEAHAGARKRSRQTTSGGRREG